MTDDPAQRSGQAYGPQRVAAQRNGNETAGNRRRRSAGRPAGRAREIMRIAGRAEMAILGRAAHAELVHVGDSDADPAGALDVGDRNRIVRRWRIVHVKLRARGRRQAGDRNLRLDRERHARKWTRLGARVDRGVDTRSAIASARGTTCGESIEGRGPLRRVSSSSPSDAFRAKPTHDVTRAYTCRSGCSALQSRACGWPAPKLFRLIRNRSPSG